MTAMPRIDVVSGNLICLVKKSRRKVWELRRRTIIKMVSYIKMHGKKANLISAHNKKPPKLEVFILIVFTG